MNTIIRLELAIAMLFALAFTISVSPSPADSADGRTGKTMTDYDGPADTPREWGPEFERLRQPSLEQAKRTYPAAKARFQGGLPRGYRFFVTVEFQEGKVHENAFLQVLSISEGKISAIVATKLLRIKNPRYGDQIVIPESEVLDWTITSADGKEEGNHIGKFLDEYYKTHR